MNQLMDMFNGFISKNGLRYSNQRELVARIFFETANHVGIEELYKKAQKVDAKIGIATVYRTLNLLVESGLAQKRHFDTGAITYEPTSDKHHDHLICLTCQEVVEFHNSDIERLQDEIAKKYKYVLRSHKMELYGECAKCRSAKKSQ